MTVLVGLELLRIAPLITSTAGNIVRMEPTIRFFVLD